MVEKGFQEEREKSVSSGVGIQENVKEQTDI